MRGRATTWALGVALAVAVAPAPALPWGCDAHHVIAYVAEGLLSERARIETRALLDANPIDPDLERFCTRMADDPFVDASMWADDVRGARPETAPWHYVDIPRGATSVGDACPASGCVVRAIEAELAVLRSDAPARRRAEALRWVIHLVGDLHQPLHAATNGDKGGNCVPVAYLGDEPARDPRTRKYSPNLHAVWDTRLVVALVARLDRPKTPESAARAIRRRLDADITRSIAEPPSVAAWAWETHQVAVEVAYGRLTPPLPVEPPVHIGDCRDNRDVGERMRALHPRIDQDYVDAALPAVERQLARAGTRLALVLNATWR